MKQCKICQSQNESDAVFCASCGQRLPEDKPPENKKPDPAKNSKGVPILIVIIGLVLVIGLGTTISLTRTIKKSAVDEVQSAVDEIQSAMPKIPTSKDAIEDTTTKFFGSDKKVGKLAGEPIKFPSYLKETERSEQYRYKKKDCSNLLTDSMQQAAYQVQKELASITQMSAKEENKIGKAITDQFNKKIRKKLDKDKKSLMYIENIGRKLITRVERKGIDYHFHVINDKSFGAFAYPGGGVYVNTGLLDQIKNEAQLAAVLAHEIKHVDLRHCIFLFQMIKQMPTVMQRAEYANLVQAMRHPYSARQEADADRRGVDLMYSFGYSPFQTVEMWYDLENSSKRKKSATKPSLGNVGTILNTVFDEIDNVIQTHPDDLKRACLLENYIIDLNNTYKYKQFYVGKWNLKNRISMFEELK